MNGAVKDTDHGGPLKLAFKRRAKNNATNLKSSTQIWRNYKILNGLAGTDDFNRHVVDPGFHYWGDFPDKNSHLRRRKIGQDSAR
jgi:hypothetical protein